MNSSVTNVNAGYVLRTLSKYYSVTLFSGTFIRAVHTEIIWPQLII